MIAPPQASKRILQPAKPWFIALTLFVALLLNMFPLGRWFFMPDWLALVLVFWCVHQPKYVAVGIAFALGLIMDVVHGGVMGQYPLSYTVMAFLTGVTARRLLWMPLWQQSLLMTPIFLLGLLILVVVHLLNHVRFPGWDYFLSAAMSAALWSPLTFLLLLPQYRAVERDENRPI